MKPIKFDRHANEVYGAMREGVHIAGYTFERACNKLEWLLADNDRWCSAGHGFTDVNKFMDSVKFDNLKAVAEVRKRVAARLKALQPALSNRRIAKALGVHEATVRRDTAAFAAPAGKKPSKIKAAKLPPAANSAPALSGAEAARTVERAGPSLRASGPGEKIDMGRDRH